MSKSLIKKILLLGSIFIVFSFVVSKILDKTYLNDFNRTKLIGSNRYDSIIKINRERWKTSKEAVLVNIYSTSDATSTSPFAYAKDIPMFFTEAFELDENIKNEFKRLGVEKLYLIGGIDSINEKVEKRINNMGIKTERIFGKNSYETSLAIANELSKIVDIKQLAVVNSIEGRADGVAMASPASKNNMPIISMNKSGRSQLVKFIEEHNIEKVYFIGNEEQFSQKFLDKIDNSIRINGKNRYDTNIKIIKEFYNLDNINEIYMTKGGKERNIDLINTLCLSTVAAKQDIPILFNSSSLGKEQKSFLKEINVKDITEVGFELVRPKFINPTTKKVGISLLIVGLWIIGIRRINYSS